MKYAPVETAVSALRSQRAFRTVAMFCGLFRQKKLAVQCSATSSFAKQKTPESRSSGGTPHHYEF
jgi:hypothetical protein